MMNMGNVLQASSFDEPILISKADKRKNDTDTRTLFQALLSTHTQGPEETSIPEALAEEADDIEEILLENWETFLYQLIHVSDNQTDHSILEELSLDGADMDWSQEEIQACVHQLLENDSIKLNASVKEELVELLNSNEIIDLSDLNDIMAAFLQPAEDKIAPFQDIMVKAEEIIQKIQSTGDVEKHSKELLQLLKQWSRLTQSQGTSSRTIFQTVFDNNDTSDKHKIWKELVKTFQKRTKLVQNKQYHSNAKVTEGDVMRWLKQLIPSSQQMSDKGITHHMTGYQSTQMSELEQYVIHIDQVRQPDSPSKQLIDQFQKVIHSSRFLTNMNGTSQLSLSIQPDNLGEMMVKLTQINGELTAKILVSSHAAKEMLEANIHQLKHMFSPHQVVIERTDVNLTSLGVINEEGDESDAEQEEQGHPDEPSDEQTDSRDDDFDTYMEELLWNEKV